MSNTGRFSATELNLHNVHHRTKEGDAIRKILALNFGKLFDADYSEIERRILANTQTEDKVSV